MERIAREIRRQIKREETLRGILRSLVGTDPFDMRLASALAGLSRLVTFDVFELGYPDPAGGTAWISLQADRESLSSGAGFHRRTVVHPGDSDGPAARALLLRSPMAVDRFGSAGAGRLPDGFDASLTVPLFCGSEITGLMAVYSRRNGSFAHGDVGLLQQFGDLLTMALEQQKASANLNNGGEAAVRLAGRLSAVSPCSPAERYLYDLGGILEAVFSIHACRLFEIRTEGAHADLVERLPGSPEDGPVLEEGRHIPLSSDLWPSLADGEIRMVEKGGAADPMLRLTVRHDPSSMAVLLPIRVDGQPAWIITAAGDPAHLGDRAMPALLRLMQNMVEQALSGMAVYRDLKSDVTRLSGLLSLTKVLAELSPESGVFQLVIDKIGELIDFDGCTLYLLDGDGTELVPVVSNEDPSRAADPPAGGERRRRWLESVLESGEARLLDGFDDGDDTAEQLLASPMLHKGRPFGVFLLLREGRRPFRPEDLSLLTTLAGFTADAMHRSLGRQEQRALNRATRLVDQHAGEGILFIDGRMQVTRASREALRILGCSAGELMGHSIRDHLFRISAEADGVVRDLLAGKTVENFRTYARPASEAPVPVAVTAALQDETAGVAGGLILVLRDATRRLRLERELGSAAVTDPLTGLKNRKEACPALATELDRGLRRDRFLSTLLFRIRGLGDYNSRHGWSEGDRMVRRVGEVIGKQIRGHMDTAYRFGDGTFLVIMPDTPGRDAEAVSRRILDGVGQTFRGRVSMDAAATQSRFADTPDTILKRLYARLDGPATALP